MPQFLVKFLFGQNSDPTWQKSQILLFFNPSLIFFFPCINMVAIKVFLKRIIHSKKLDQKMHFVQFHCQIHFVNSILSNTTCLSKSNLDFYYVLPGFMLNKKLFKKTLSFLRQNTLLRHRAQKLENLAIYNCQQTFTLWISIQS